LSGLHFGGPSGLDREAARGEIGLGCRHLPVILTQHFSPGDRVYEDAEYSLYHYPKIYFTRVRPFDRFIYYRPLGKFAARPDSKHYFGHGLLGEFFEDPIRSDHRFVKIIKGEQFRLLVPIIDQWSHYFETETDRPPQFASSVRDISETAYYKILAAADASSATLSLLPSTDNLQDIVAAVGLPTAPKDGFREISAIPPGAGYVPSGNTFVNVYESAALQERARKDHQLVLKVIQTEVHRRGGSTWYNNNVDLLARVGDERMLIEAKSLNDFRDTVNRMRYGIGQLADYAYRYQDELGNATKVLAFANAPPRETAWVGAVLDQERTAFVSASERGIEALNETAKKLAIVGP
jgi:hypothetical protein